MDLSDLLSLAGAFAGSHTALVTAAVTLLSAAGVFDGINRVAGPYIAALYSSRPTKFALAVFQAFEDGKLEVSELMDAYKASGQD